MQSFKWLEFCHTVWPPICIERFTKWLVSRFRKEPYKRAMVLSYSQICENNCILSHVKVNIRIEGTAVSFNFNTATS